MSDQEIIPLETYCSYCQVEMEFVRALEEHGLIRIEYRETRAFIPREEVPQIEQFSRLYYELSINVPGIDALRHLLQKIKDLQRETDELRGRLRIYE